MKPKLLLISHGYFAEETLNSAKMIFGEVEDIYTVSMLADDGKHGTIDKLRLILNKITDAEVIICVDILGGTPCNAALEISEEFNNITIIAGLNLAMIIEYIVSDFNNRIEMANYLENIGKDSIQIINKIEINNEEEGYED